MRFKPSSALSHRGRAHSRYVFELSQLRVESGLPSSLSATGIIVQCSRGPKITATKEVEYTQEAKESGGDLDWRAQKLSFVATLFASKTGKATGFSDKRYKVTVMAVKPTFGTSKRVLKEIAATELNISEYATTEQPCPITLQLDRRAHDGLPVVLHCTVAARAVAGGDGDDDDDASISSAQTGCSSVRFDGSEAASGAPDLTTLYEQDLDGFGEELKTQVHGRMHGSVCVRACAWTWAHGCAWAGRWA